MGSWQNVSRSSLSLIGRLWSSGTLERRGSCPRKAVMSAGRRSGMSRATASSVLEEATCDRLGLWVTTVAERTPMAVRAPFTGDDVGSVPACQPADVAAAVDRARDAQAAWADRPVAERAETLRRVGDQFLSNRDELLDIVQ